MVSTTASPASRAVPSPACDLAMSAAHEFDGEASERTLEGVARKDRERCERLDEELYGLILSSIEVIQTAEEATEKQKSEI